MPMDVEKTQMRWADLGSPVVWRNGQVGLLDQRLLPHEERWRLYERAADVAVAIGEMVVRGAPAIGCAAAYGLAAEAHWFSDNRSDPIGLSQAFDEACQQLIASRPTAVNLAWAVGRQREVFAVHRSAGVASLAAALEQEALSIANEDLQNCRAIGTHGAALLPAGGGILTYCNAGALATAGYGTALGVIRAAARGGKAPRVYACETRPYLQGARLTAWELLGDGLDVTLICDNMAAALMRQGQISSCIVGADRIARNGDVANKIGTYGLAVLCRHHEIPFYVAAPYSTFDPAIESGAEIPIEERPADEVLSLGSSTIAMPGLKVCYPAFDVTPAALVTAIVTQSSVLTPPLAVTIDRFLADNLGTRRRV